MSLGPRSAADLDMEIMRNLAARLQREHERVERTLAALTERERRLVREAAVMGYVRGARSVPGGHLAQIGPHAEILAEVVGACLSMPDLYPIFALAGRDWLDTHPEADR